MQEAPGIIARCALPPNAHPRAFMWFPLAEPGSLVPLWPRAVPARFILLTKVTCLKEKPNASPSGSEKKQGEADWGLRNAPDLPLPSREVAGPVSGVAAPHGPAGLGSARLLLRGAPGNAAGLRGRGRWNLETPSERGQGGISQRGAAVWQGKARTDGNTGSFI